MTVQEHIDKRLEEIFGIGKAIRLLRRQKRKRRRKGSGGLPHSAVLGDLENLATTAIDKIMDRQEKLEDLFDQIVELQTQAEEDREELERLLKVL